MRLGPKSSSTLRLRCLFAAALFSCLCSLCCCFKLSGHARTLVSLPPPVQLRVEYLPTWGLSSELANVPSQGAVGVGCIEPFFSFVPVVADPAGSDRNVSVASARLRIYTTRPSLSARPSPPANDSNSDVWWDSGDVPQPRPGATGANAAALGVRYDSDGGVRLLPTAQALFFTMQWTAMDGRRSPPSSPARFVQAPNKDAEWGGAQWVGAGHGQFRATFSLPQHSAGRSDIVTGVGVHPRTERMFDAFVVLAAPGGAVVQVDDKTTSDSVGVGAWFDWTASLPAYVLDVSDLLVPAQATHELRVTLGCGCWCPSPVPTVEHSGRTVHTRAGAQPLARVLLVVRNTDTGEVAVTLASGDGNFSSRPGPVLNSSSWLGATSDWTMSDDEGWESPARLVPNDTLRLDMPIAPSSSTPLPPTPLQQPPMKTFPPESTLLATKIWTPKYLPNGTTVSVQGMLYEFENMVVGTADVLASAWTGQGALHLEFCEFTEKVVRIIDGHVQQSVIRCVRQSGYETSGVVDTHIVDSNVYNGRLRGAFAWRGFQFVIATTSGNATIQGTAEDIEAVWSGLDLETSTVVAFGGRASTADGHAAAAASQLRKLTDLTARSFRSNLLTGLPTDCPTREKHAWLGDASDIAIAAAYTFFIPSVFNSFVDTIIAGQAKADNRSEGGFVPVAVPCHGGVDAIQNDISWTSGFAAAMGMLNLFYGSKVNATSASTDKRFRALRAWVNGQVWNASADGLLPRTDGLPDFSVYGDLSSVAYNDPSQSRDETGRRCAAANFMIALQRSIELAENGGQGPDASAQDDVQKWTMQLEQFRSAFDAQYYTGDGRTSINANISAGGFAVANATLTRQTVNALAVAALRPSKSLQQHVADAEAELLHDVTSRNFSLTVGAVGQTLLLSTLSSMADPAGHDAALRIALGTNFPGWGYWLSLNASTCWESWTSMDQPGDDHFHGSRNHGWLCGGIAQWIYGSLGGIVPTSAGFSTVSIAPRISQTVGLGPDDMNMTINTMRGAVSSNWTRQSHAGKVAHLGISIEVPPSTQAIVTLPLLPNSSAFWVPYSNEAMRVQLDKQPHIGSMRDPAIVRVLGHLCRGQLASYPQGHPAVPPVRQLPRVDGIPCDPVLQLQVPSGRFEFSVVSNGPS